MLLILSPKTPAVFDNLPSPGEVTGAQSLYCAATTLDESTLIPAPIVLETEIFLR